MRMLSAGFWASAGRPRERVDAQLNLIPMIDILSVLVAFLLVYSTDVEVLQNSEGVTIPQSRTDVRPKQSVVVMVTKDAVLVQGETVVSLAPASDPHVPLIEPLRAVLQRPIAGLDAAARAAALTSKEGTVLADNHLPSEVLTNIPPTS